MPKLVTKTQKYQVRKMLNKIADAHVSHKTKRAHYWTLQYLSSHSAKIIAVEEAFRKMRREDRPEHGELTAIAQRLDPWKGTREQVFAYLKPKGSEGDFRIVMDFGIENRALQHLLRPLIRKVCPLHPSQFAHSGGVKAAIKAVVGILSQSSVWAIETDVEDCYSSFEGERLSSLLPLPKEVIENSLISQYLNIASGNIRELLISPADNECDWLLDKLLADARRGIPQGSATSPLIAETMLSSALAQVPLIGYMAGYADNTLLMATSECSVVTMYLALKSALEAHPVGRLRLRKRMFSPGEPIDFLGHRLTKQGGLVRISPTLENTVKFEATVKSMFRRLGGTNLSADRRTIENANHYIRSWSAAFSLCDGIEELRDEQLAHLTAYP